MFLSFRSALRGLTAPSWRLVRLCNSNHYGVCRDAFHAIGLSSECTIFSELHRTERDSMPIEVRLATLSYSACRTTLGTANLPLPKPGETYRETVQTADSGSGPRHTAGGDKLLLPRLPLVYLFGGCCMNIHKLFKMLYLWEINWTWALCEDKLITGTTKACLCFTKMF